MNLLRSANIGCGGGINRIPIPGKTDEPAGTGDPRTDPEQSPQAARQALIVLGPFMW